MVNLMLKLFQSLDVNSCTLSYQKLFFLFVFHESYSAFRCGEEPVFSPVRYIVP